MRPAADVPDPESASISNGRDTPDFRGGRIVTRHRRAWTGVSALHLDLRSDAGFEAELPAVAPRLLFSIEAFGGQVQVVPARQHALFRHSGPVSVVPGATTVLVRGRARRFRQLMLSFDELDPAVSDQGIDLALAFQPRFMFADPCVDKLCLLLADECVSPTPMGSLFGDSLILSLLMALSRDPGDRGRSTGGLAPWQLRRLESFVEAHLGEDLSLDRLAREAGVSRSHLNRVFKRTVGQSPFSWVRSKRIERAKHLLADGALSVAEVAIATGFADQAHLTRLFSRLVGLPPGTWRRTRSRDVDDDLSTNVQNGDASTIEPSRIVA